MIKVTACPNNVIKLEAEPNLVIYESIENIDNLIQQLLAQKANITEFESLARYYKVGIIGS